MHLLSSQEALRVIEEPCESVTTLEIFRVYMAANPLFLIHDQSHGKSEYPHVGRSLRINLAKLGFGQLNIYSVHMVP